MTRAWSAAGLSALASSAAGLDFSQLFILPQEAFRNIPAGQPGTLMEELVGVSPAALRAAAAAAADTMEPIFPMRSLEAALLKSDAEALASLRDTVEASARRHSVGDGDDSPAERWHVAHTRVLDAAEAVMHGHYLDLLHRPRYGFLFGDSSVEAAKCFAASPQFDAVPAPTAAGPKTADACRFIAFVRAQLHGFIDAGAPTYADAMKRPECQDDESGDEMSSARFLRAVEALIVLVAAQSLYVQVRRPPRPAIHGDRPQPPASPPRR